jgi:hypothetical protein
MKHLIIITLLSLLIGCSKESIEIENQLKDTTMALPATDITTSLVSNTIGLASNKVGELCAKSKTGGTSGFAFNIAENGGQTWDGTLISGAEPYWNKYSNDSPGEWCLPANQTEPVYFRLKRDINIPSRYSFQLGGFRAYNHEAAAPLTMSGSLTYPWTGGILNTTLAPACRTGHYNWSKLGAGYVKTIIYNEDGTIWYQSGAKPIDTTNALIHFDSQAVSIACNVENGYTAVKTAKLFICTSDGNEMGVLASNSLSVVQTRKPLQPSLTGLFNGKVAFLFAPAVVNGSLITSNATYRGLYDADNMDLVSIVYTLRNIDTNVVLNTLTLTTFSASVSPLTTDAYTTNDIEAFTALVSPGGIPDQDGIATRLFITMNYQ